MPFDIPESWVWIRQKNICWLDNGIKSKGITLPYLEAKVIRGLKEPILVNEGVIVDKNIRVMLIDGENSGEIMVSPYRGYMGSTFKIFSATMLFNYDYLLFIFLYNKNLYKNSKVGAAIPHLNREIFRETLIAVPPLNEQLRIVNKIVKLESLLEIYETYEKKLSKLETEFPEKLKKSILQYAIEGKLVKQNPEDEPASILLERIKKEKEKLVIEGKIKKEKNESYIYQCDDKNYYENNKQKSSKIDVPFSIPRNWVWVKTQQLIKSVQYGFNGAGLVGGTSKFLRITDIQNGTVNWDALPYCNVTEEQLKIYQIQENDIFIARTGGTIGKSFRLNEYKSNVVFAGYLIRFSFIEQKISEYIELFLNTPLYWSQVADKSGGTGQPNINGVSLSNLLIPLPPLTEQKRIKERIKIIFDLI